MVGRIQRVLWDVAVEQYGYISTNDARDLEVRTVELRKLAARGQLEHVAHGVYRFPQIPVTERDSYMLATLWTGCRNAVLSHETALAVYELCDVNPDRIHLAVPISSRIRRQGSALYEVHRERLSEADTAWWEGIKIVSPKAAIGQGIAIGTPAYLLRQALNGARAAGRITDKEHFLLQTALELRK